VIVRFHAIHSSNLHAKRQPRPPRTDKNYFTSGIYNPPSSKHDDTADGETKMPSASQPAVKQKTMATKSKAKKPAAKKPVAKKKVAAKKKK
jgi:hypothetical protein